MRNDVVNLDAVGALTENAAVSVSFQRFPPRSLPVLVVRRRPAAAPEVRLLAARYQRPVLPVARPATANLPGCRRRALDVFPANRALMDGRPRPVPSCRAIARGGAIALTERGLRDVEDDTAVLARLVRAVLGIGGNPVRRYRPPLLGRRPPTEAPAFVGAIAPPARVVRNLASAVGAYAGDAAGNTRARRTTTGPRVMASERRFAVAAVRGARTGAACDVARLAPLGSAVLWSAAVRTGIPSVRLSGHSDDLHTGLRGAAPGLLTQRPALLCPPIIPQRRLNPRYAEMITRQLDRTQPPLFGEVVAVEAVTPAPANGHRQAAMEGMER